MIDSWKYWSSITLTYHICVCSLVTTPHLGKNHLTKKNGNINNGTSFTSDREVGEISEARPFPPSWPIFKENTEKGPKQ